MITVCELPDRIRTKISPEPNSGCWLWLAAGSRLGYGRIRMNNPRRGAMAHRVVYELLAGPIPKGLELDHLCRTPYCVNPEHLEPVTRKVNANRGLSGKGKARLDLRWERCLAGHLLSDTARRLRDGSRVCVICSRRHVNEHSARMRELYGARWREKLAAAAPGLPAPIDNSPKKCIYCGSDFRRQKKSTDDRSWCYAERCEMDREVMRQRKYIANKRMRLENLKEKGAI